MNSKEPEKFIKVLISQLKPILKKKHENLERVIKSLKNYSQKDDLDIILFPEMAFTGYNFKDQEDALPMAVTYADPNSLDFQFAIRESQRLGCYVVFGYLEKENVNGSIKLFNSAAVINREGVPILNYRKTHLYIADELWASEGDGFKSLEIKNKKGETFNTVLGICMDLNEKNFTSGQYEWAEFALQQKAELLLFLTNWIDHQPDSQDDSTVLSMYNYWIHRMRPLISVPSKNEIKNPMLFFAADRVGVELTYKEMKEETFFGCSCAIHLNPPYIIQKLSKVEEGYLLIEGKLPKERPYK